MIAPFAVALEYRGQGIGGDLLREGCRIARSMGYKAAFLCGDPLYYQRYGFKPISQYEITHESIPEPYVMGYEIVEGALDGITGVVRIE